MHILAADLGATSGRLMLGTITDGHIALSQLVRFPNEMQSRGERRLWDIRAMFDHILEGVAKAPADVASLGVDTWGVDYGYIDAQGNLLGDILAYRDSRTDDDLERLTREVPDLYLRSGIQIMFFNTLFQVVDDLTTRPEVVQRAARVLLLPDLINYMLTGTAFNEYTICSTSGLLNMRSRQWDTEFMQRYGLRRELFGDVTMPGRTVGPLKDELARRTGRRFPVCLVAGHDTASAIAGVPVLPGRAWGYISSGTWSLVGVELDEPIINDVSARYQITNEGGVENTIRFLKNVNAMWLLEECIRAWTREGVPCDYDTIIGSARAAQPFRSLIAPSRPRFAAPKSMLAEIQGYCRETSQPVPETVAEVARCIFESLALNYRAVFGEIACATGRPVEEIHIVGGGSRNEFLNQMTADACGVPVVRGPAEATVMGNIALQAIALGVYRNIADYREQQALASSPTRYEPREEAAWRDAFERFQNLA